MYNKGKRYIFEIHSGELIIQILDNEWAYMEKILPDRVYDIPISRKRAANLMRKYRSQLKEIRHE